MQTAIAKTKRGPGRPKGSSQKVPKPVLAVRVDAGLRDQVFKMARVAGTTPSKLMQGILSEAMGQQR